MDVLILNRSADIRRIVFQRQQLAALGLRFQRVDAVTPKTLRPAGHDQYWTRWERPMTDTEKAIFASHRRAWEIIAARDGPALLLEDDVCLSADVPVFLDRIIDMTGVDRITLEVRGRKKLVAIQSESFWSVRQLYQDRTGAAAYVLWPAGARKLLARCVSRPGLADAVLCSAYDLQTFQADPALAVQLDQYQYQVGTPPLMFDSTNSPYAAVPCNQDSSFGRALYRLRRLCAQLRMGIRYLRNIRRGVWRHVAVSQDWPNLGVPCRSGCMGSPPVSIVAASGDAGETSKL